MIGQRLRGLREKRNLTQEQVAKILGITRPAYTQYETGKREPDPETLAKLAEIYQVTTDYLIKGTNDPAQKRSILNDVIENLTPEEVEQLRTLLQEEVAFKELLSSPTETIKDFLRAWTIMQKMNKGKTK
ncbi:hypothetical protein DNHGIG_19140 [Collibacillus ludicampi]|jgi:transcriptional regulator with XRE-family HTH domain|uniref:HTH cro/C1-type domain-containing protein n=1 Tax=Collibacillus ludicampi TaxID=2771369 RepID=A0AAV4LF01_9BACL|nr:helix-turn-helix domain-containing protein [Collibacillus ludicampi]GIM46365.1 hypothetical protein DNHGIG_19140 [Collibacillus ludicampi]